MDKTNYSELVETIRTLYSIPTGTLKICYVDDEADTVIVATDEEFSYAAELIRPLKLVVKHAPTSIPVPQTMPCEVVSTPTMEVETPFPSCRRGRGRGHCGEFKPRCERRNQWKEEKLTLSKEEKISRKKTWISERISHLEELSLQDLPAHRQRTISWKLEKLRSKLETLQLVEGASSSPVEETTPTVAPSEPENSRRGCRGRGGRGGCGRGRKPFEHHETSENTENHGEKPENPLWQCRKALRAARDSGDQAEIDRCSQALEEAKTQKWEAKKAEKTLDNPFYLLKEHKRECLKNLRGANASGDGKRIQECVEALIEAKEALQKAKVASKC